MDPGESQCLDRRQSRHTVPKYSRCCTLSESRDTYDTTIPSANAWLFTHCRHPSCPLRIFEYPHCLWHCTATMSRLPVLALLRQTVRPNPRQSFNKPPESGLPPVCIFWEISHWLETWANSKCSTANWALDDVLHIASPFLPVLQYMPSTTIGNCTKSMPHTCNASSLQIE